MGFDSSRTSRQGFCAPIEERGRGRQYGERRNARRWEPQFQGQVRAELPDRKIAYSTPGLMTSTGQLESMGLVAAPEKPAPPILRLSGMDRIRTSKWPSYQRCVQDAPENRDKTGPDIYRADFTWCMTAISWGHTIEATAAQLVEESSKEARENGERYAQMTAENAAAAVARRERSRA